MVSLGSSYVDPFLPSSYCELSAEESSGGKHMRKLHLNPFTASDGPLHSLSGAFMFIPQVITHDAKCESQSVP